MELVDAAPEPKLGPMAPANEPPSPALMMALGLYGSAMLQVQMFEMALAVLVSVAEIGRSSSSSWQRELREVIRTKWHRFNRASASELVRLLDDTPVQLGEPLASNIKNLIKWRDFLAHRYLRVRLVKSRSSARPAVIDADADTVIELQELAQAFAETATRIHGEVARLLAAHPKRLKTTPDDVQTVMEDLARSVLAPGVTRFRRAAPMPPPDSPGRASF